MLPMFLALALASAPEAPTAPSEAREHVGLVAGQVVVGSIVSAATLFGGGAIGVSFVCSGGRDCDVAGPVTFVAVALLVTPLGTAGVVQAMAPEDRRGPGRFWRTWAGAAIGTIPPVIALGAALSPNHGGLGSGDALGQALVFGLLGGMLLPPIAATIASWAPISVAATPSRDGVAFVAIGRF